MAKALDIKGNGFTPGEPYFCDQCKRNHTKGKIYKEHAKYAKNGDSEVENVAPEDENIDVNEEKLDSNEDYDDEEELIEAFDELEKEAEVLEQDVEEALEEIEEADVDEYEDEEEAEEFKEAIKDDGARDIANLPGVGDATLKKLVGAGFSSLESIAFTPPKIIQEDTGIGEKTTAKLVKTSMAKLGIGFKSASEVWEHRKNIAKITTGCKELDDLLGGGIETGSLIEFFGEFRTGKTQIAHQLCVNVQLPRDKGGLEARALYIDTEGTFRPERIIQMSEHLDLDHKKVLKNIVFGRAYNSDHQILLIKEASNIIADKNIKLIVVDSIIGHFRSEFIGRGTLATRQQTINAHLHDLLRLCDIFPELAVIVTNQVQSKPDVFYGNPLRATGGNIIAHGSTIRVYLRKGKGEQRVAKVVDAPHLPEGDAVFSITENGITE